MVHFLCNFIYFLFITSTYRDLAGFFAPLAPEAGRVDNSASRGSNFCAAGFGCKADAGLDGGKSESCNADSDFEEGVVVIGAGVWVMGVRGGGNVGEIMLVVGTGAICADTSLAGRFGGGGGGAVFVGAFPS
jgi:hypothetical protein